MLRILVYHRIAEPDETPGLDPSVVSATPETFRRHMEHVRRWYEPVSVEDVAVAFERGTPLPRRAVLVTVDDAYRDFAHVAWPTLSDLGIPVVVFVPSAYPGEAASFWWDRLSRVPADVQRSGWARRVRDVALTHTAAGALADPEGADPRSLLREIPHEAAEELVDEACLVAGISPSSVEPAPVLDWSELRSLAREGVSFGAHTRHHVALSHVDTDRMREEIRGSLADLRRELAVDRPMLAYPYGVYNDAVLRVAREEGCRLGFTCDDGLNDPAEIDPLRLRRTNITRRTSARLFPLRMLPWFAALDRVRHGRQRRRLTA